MSDDTGKSKRELRAEAVRRLHSLDLFLHYDSESVLSAAVGHCPTKQCNDDAVYEERPVREKGLLIELLTDDYSTVAAASIEDLVADLENYWGIRARLGLGGFEIERVDRGQQDQGSGAEAPDYDALIRILKHNFGLSVTWDGLLHLWHIGMAPDSKSRTGSRFWIAANFWRAANARLRQQNESLVDLLRDAGREYTLQHTLLGDYVDGYNELVDSIDSGYARLPVDADGVIIKVNDCVVREGEPDVYLVKHLRYEGGGWRISLRTHLRTGFYWKDVDDPRTLRHVNDPRSLLMEFADKASDISEGRALDLLVEEYAEKLRLSEAGDD